MKSLPISSLGKLATALVLCAALAGAPVFADKGGNGNGGGGGNAGGNSNAGGNGNAGGNSNAGGNGKGNTGSNSSNGNGAGNSKASKSSSAGDTGTDTSGATTGKSYGTVNGFLHASANGVKHASANSAVGRVRDAYAAVASTAIDGQQLLDGLQAYSKKPVNKLMILAANQQLADAGLIDEARLAELNTFADQLP